MKQPTVSKELFPIIRLNQLLDEHGRFTHWYAECPDPSGQGSINLKLTTTELWNPSKLQQIFAERFAHVFIVTKPDWIERLRELMNQ